MLGLKQFDKAFDSAYRLYSWTALYVTAQFPVTEGDLLLLVNCYQVYYCPDAVSVII